MSNDTMVSREDVSAEAQTKVTVTFGPMRRTYQLWETTAPARYDYHGTLHLYGDASPDKDKTESRFVLVDDVGRPGTDEPYQVGRYRSGLYGTRRSDTFDTVEVSEMLRAALYSALYKGGE